MTAIKQHHARRVQKLEEMIEERRLAIEEHESGRRRLSDDEYSKKANQHKTFTRKLEQMKAKTDVSVVSGGNVDRVVLFCWSSVNSMRPASSWYSWLLLHF